MKRHIQKPMNVIIAINKFLKHLASSGYARATLEGYTKGIIAFSRYLKQSGIEDIKHVNEETVRQYQRALVSSPLAPETRALRIRPVKRLFEYLVQNNHLLINPVDSIVEVSRRQRKIGPVLSERKMARLLEQPDMKTMAGLRNRAIMELFYSTGIRLGELLGLQTNDVDLKGGVVFVRRGKGARHRVVPLGTRAADCLSEYLGHVRSHHQNGPLNCQSLFLTTRGGPLSAGVIRFFLKTYKAAAGIETPVSPHVFRRSCATHLLSTGADIRYVQQLLGHTSLKVTHCYTKVLPVDLKRTHAKTHPGVADADD